MAATQIQDTYSFHALYVQNLERGDIATTNHFLSYFRPRLRSFLRRNGVPTDSVEDLQQETLLRVLAVLQSKGIHHPERLGGFVQSVCRNTLLELHRKTRRYVELDDSIYELPCAGLNPDTILSEKEATGLIQDVLSRLSVQDQKLLRALLIEGQSRSEICDDLGVSRAYLRILLYRAKRQFVSHMKKNEVRHFWRYSKGPLSYGPRNRGIPGRRDDQSDRAKCNGKI